MRLVFLRDAPTVYLLVAGLVLWSTAHLFPSKAVAVRSRIISAMGPMPYKGLFSLVIVASLVMIVMGWQSTPPTVLWNPPVALRHAVILLMLPALIMFVAARVPGNPIKVKLKHPQLMGVGTWALAHLLANGEVRSILLFGTMLIWSFVNIKAINARDGKPRPTMSDKPGLMFAITVIIGAALWAGLMFAHPHFTGRAVIAL